MSEHSAINTATNLSKTLGHRFVLVAGSAISGVAFPNLPMVTIKNTITQNLQLKLITTDYSGHLYATYAHALAEGYGKILEDTLFEEFLGELAYASDRNTLNVLLKKLYYCEETDYGPNHEAIARLLESGQCCACFTTNFDNAIEMACRSIGLDLRVWDVIQTRNYPDSLPHEGDAPLLIKMHGCITNNTCVAESREILEAKSIERHSPLKNLLKGRRVLVVGYSGAGDIDIARHFHINNSRFLFANRTADRPLPPWSEQRVICDLSSRTPNLLRELAGLESVSSRKYPERRSQEKLIENWIKAAPLDAKHLIRSLLKWRKADVLLELSHADRQSCHRDVPDLSDGLLHLQRGAYKTALQIYEHLSTCKGRSIEQVLESKGGQAFAEWRLGRWKEARERLAGLLPLVKNLIQQNSHTSNKSIEEQCFNVCRVYIEVCVDDLQLMPTELARRKAMEWNINEANELLMKLHHPNPQDQLLAQIAACQVEWITKRQGNMRQLDEIFHDCMDRQYLNSAWAATRLALQISLEEGLAYYRKLTKALREIHRTHYIWKNRESLFIALVTRRIIKHNRWRYLLIKRVLTLWYSVRTSYVEITHKHEVSQWTDKLRGWDRMKRTS